MSQTPLHIHWFRRDLRLHDHRALFEAAGNGLPILPLFIFDTAILDGLSARRDRRVHFIHDRLQRIKADLEAAGSTLLVLHGRPIEVWKQVLDRYRVASVSVVRDYEPYARTRDRLLEDLCRARGIRFRSSKDQVIFEMNEITKRDGGHYRVFTPYSKSWRRFLDQESLRNFPVDLQSFCQVDPVPMPTLDDLNFEETDRVHFPSGEVSDERIRLYHESRETPALDGTTRLSVHLRFGTVSIRSLVKRALSLNERFLNELIWRDFFHMTLFHHPESPEKAIKPAYDRIRWEENRSHFEAWCEGKTGYPLVDAGMRELNGTGFMHNRVRMVTASFLTRHLLIDWRKGERYFAEKLFDFDLASNVGGWQWAAGCGNDAAPYFRIFNPTRQQEKYDPDGRYIRRYLPEYGTERYPDPIVDHKVARERSLKRYREALF